MPTMTQNATQPVNSIFSDLNEDFINMIEAFVQETAVQIDKLVALQSK